MGSIHGGKLKVENDLTKVAICPLCKLGSTLQEWDDVTYENCQSRALKRDYIHIKDRRALKKDNKLRYLCPYCRRFTLGHMLKITTQEEYDNYVPENK